jgi:hypothetical protein
LELSSQAPETRSGYLRAAACGARRGAQVDEVRDELDRLRADLAAAGRKVKVPH